MFIKFLDWLGRFQIIQALGHYAWAYIPALWVVLTGSAGIVGGAPLMYVMVAVTVVAAFALWAFQLFSVQKDYNSPLNKLKILNTVFAHDLAPAEEHNRQIRRGVAKTKLIVPARPRRITKCQLGVEVLNTASFPISVIAWSAETELYGKNPPRTKYPKLPALLQPGGTVWIHDEPIELNAPCELLNGSINITIRYGKPGDEKYTLVHNGTVEVFMEPVGFLKGVYFHPASAAA